MSLVIGTRPEAIKLAPLAKALAKRGIVPQLVLTGQHPQLDPRSFGLSGFPAVELGCPGSADPHQHVAGVARSIGSAIAGSGLVVVQGDTSSALGGALGAAQAGVPVAHVEAGLRSHDRAHPWPEEDFRIAIDALAGLLFAPTALNAANLRREAVRGEIMATGNTGIDALLEQMQILSERPPEKGVRRLLVTCHRRESWGEGLASIAFCLRRIADLANVEVSVVLHPNPRVRDDLRQLLDGHPNIRLEDPCGHLQMLERVRGSDLVLSDSGGLQEEAPALGVPLLVLRDRTERPEGIVSGNTILAGRDPQRIFAIVEALLRDERLLKRMSRPALPFGDGQASERIADAIARRLNAEATAAAA